MSYWRSQLTDDELTEGEGLGDAPVEALPETAFNPDGRYFISYRSVDGNDLADEFQTRLRAAGLSAWRDAADLKLGRIGTRLTQALTGGKGFTGAGLAGALLIATPRVWTSTPVRHLEAPIILELAKRHEDDGFQLAIANAVPSSDGGPAAMDGADEVYGLAKGTLSPYLMHDVTTVDGRERIVRHFLEDRVDHRIEMLRHGHPLKIDVSSRQPLATKDKPQSLYGDSDLMVRLHQQDHRWPAFEALVAFAAGMSDLAAAVPYGLPVQIRGSIHPSIALALGATFSATRPGQVVECLHERGDKLSAWRSDAPRPATPRQIVVDQCPGGDTTSGTGVLVMIVATCTPADQMAFDELARQPGFKAIYRIELTHWDPIEAEEGNDLALRLSEELQGLSSQGELHVAFVGPWALALLLGHRLSAKSYVSYEWDNSAHRSKPAYQPSLRITPGIRRHLTVVAPNESS